MISDKEDNGFHIEIDLNTKLPGTHLKFPLAGKNYHKLIVFLWSNYFSHKHLVVLNNTNYNTNVNTNINIHTGSMYE